MQFFKYLHRLGENLTVNYIEFILSLSIRQAIPEKGLIVSTKWPFIKHG